MGEYVKHAEKLKKYGYDILVDTDLEGFKRRVKAKLGLDYPGKPGTGKVWDYRACLGYLYEDELIGYDYWGHTDFDCVYGKIDDFMPDEELSKLDIWSNHDTYMCGAWSLYRNVPKVNQLFMKGALDKHLGGEEITAWVEGEFSRIVENSGLKYKYTLYQNKNFSDMSKISFDGEKLYDGEKEIMMAHFRRTKAWPL